MGKWIAGGVAVLSLIGALVAVYVFGPKDDELIYSAIQESVKASEEGRPYGVMEHLMGSFTYNETVPNRGQIAMVIRDLKPKVALLGRDLRIDGDNAVFRSPARVSLHESGTFELPMVSVEMIRQTGTRWMIFPYPKWRVSKVSADQLDASVFAGAVLSGP
jgi:hypothetical protein